MDDFGITYSEWMKQLKPALTGTAQTLWQDMAREDRQRYSRVKARLIRKLGASVSEKRRHWWDLSPKDREPLSHWYRQVKEATDRYLRDLKLSEILYST